MLAYGQTGSGKTFTVLGGGGASESVTSSSSGKSSKSKSKKNKSTSPRNNGGADGGGSGGLNSKDGVIPRALRDLFSRLEQQKQIKMRESKSKLNSTNNNSNNNDSNNEDSEEDDEQEEQDQQKEQQQPFEYEVRIQFLEVYGEQIRDLLSSTHFDSNANGTRLVIRDGGNSSGNGKHNHHHNQEPEVIGATEVKVTSAEEALLYLTRGMLRRVTGETAMNKQSSRSHAIISVVVEQRSMTEVATSNSAVVATTALGNVNDTEVEMEMKRSKFHFVDLAGSERQKRSQAQGLRLKEGIDINKGLLVLGNVISALGEKKKKAFVPYRDSKLTRLLKGSLGGNHKTLMIACVSPSSINMEESLNCLRYASRAKNIENNAVVNVDGNGAGNNSRLVGVLRNQVKALAGELLVFRERDPNTGHGDDKLFQVETLRALARGEDSADVAVKGTGTAMGGRGQGRDDVSTPRSSGRSRKHLQSENTNTSRSMSINTHTNTSAIASRNDAILVKKIKAELGKLRSTTRQLKSDLRSKSEELFAAKAETEYHRLQAEDGIGMGMGTKKNEDGDKNSDDRDYPEDDMKENEGEGKGRHGQSKKDFMKRCREYEREIAKCKKQLANMKAQAAIALAQKELDDGITASTHSMAMTSINDYPPISPEKRGRKGKRSNGNASTSADSDAAKDTEHMVEEAEISKITNKYLKMGNKERLGVDEEHEEKRRENDDEDDDDDDDTDSEDEDEEETQQSWQSHVDAHVTQLSRGIAAKEELVEQLERSQLKYEKMKSFYHDKMKKMSVQLSVQEAEKMNLETELKKFENDSQKSRELQDALTKKQKHIDHLKKRQHELKNLTSIASRNEAVIGNLSKEIEDMKKQKVALQKQLMKERKEHAQSIQQLQKKANAGQKSANKLKEKLAITMAQKQRVQTIAKSRAEEVSVLRSKYQSAEKRLRMQTLKRGVMERAGIDPVLVGRHEQHKKVSSSRSVTSRSTTGSFERHRTHSSADIHRMRTVLDEKIAEVSRKEVTADKLAHEWEDHLELATRKEQMIIESKSRPHDIHLSDEVEALEFQILYKESRIRQLAQRLGQSTSTIGRSMHGPLQDTLFDDRKLKSITSDLPTLAAAQMTSKVLFGMVVKERRRVATLARAASSLDQKAVEAEKLAASKGAALQSLMEESRNEKVKMAQQSQDRILSLMELVQEEDKQEDGVDQSQPSESVLLRFANERVETLEERIETLEKEKENNVNYQQRENETVVELTRLTEDHSLLIDKSKTLRTSLRKIRSKLDASGGHVETSMRSVVSKIIDRALETTKISNANNSSPLKQHRKITSPFDLESDDEEEVQEKEVPEWADHIMKDLAIIAAGDVPAILKTPRGRRLKPPAPGNSVFDRLSSPDNYTNSHYERLSDGNNSVDSSKSQNRSSSNSRYSTPTRSRMPHSTPTRGRITQNTPLSHGTLTRGRPSTYHDTPPRTSVNRSFRATSPLRPRPISPALSTSSRLSNRVSAILKDGPPKILTVPNTPDDDQSIGSYRSLGSVSAQSLRQRGRSDFVGAYTKKNVFERLQKKHTNSYTFAVQASASSSVEDGR